MQELAIKTVVKVTDPEFTEQWGDIGKITEVNGSNYYVVPAKVKGKNGMWVPDRFLSVYDAEAEAAQAEESAEEASDEA